MGYGDTVAETGRAEFFSGEQGFEHGLFFQYGHLLADQLGDLLEYAFFTAARHVHDGTAEGQDIFESYHGWGVSASGGTLQVALLFFLMLEQLSVELVGE
jgi:hypothetical protein